MPVYHIPYILEPDGKEDPDALDHINQNFQALSRAEATIETLETQNTQQQAHLDALPATYVKKTGDTMAGNLLPSGSVSLGSSGARWQQGYFVNLNLTEALTTATINVTGASSGQIYTIADGTLIGNNRGGGMAYVLVRGSTGATGEFSPYVSGALMLGSPERRWSTGYFQGLNISNDLVPSRTNQYLGASSNSWQRVYAFDINSTGTIYGVDVSLSGSLNITGASSGQLCVNANGMLIGNNRGGGMAYTIMRGSSNATGEFSPYVSGALMLGSTERRWSTVFATSGTINTCDSRMKSDIHPVLSSDKVQESGKLKTFALNDEKALTEDDVLNVLDNLNPITFAYKRAVDKTPHMTITGGDGQEREEPDLESAQIEYEDRTIEEALEEDPAAVQLGIAAEQLRGTRLFDYLCMEAEDGTVMLKQASMIGLLVAQNKILKQRIEALETQMENVLKRLEAYEQEKSGK